MTIDIDPKPADGTTFDTEHAGVWGEALKLKTNRSTWQGKQTVRCEMYVDVVAIFEKIRAHLPGEWSVVKEPNERSDYEGRTRHYCEIERKKDGLKLYLTASTNYGREYALKVSLGHYENARGEPIDVRYLHHGMGPDAKRFESPDARMSLSKKTPKQVAKDIERRVIEPALPILALIRKRQGEAQEAENKRKATVKLLRELGAIVHDRNGNEKDPYISLKGGPTINVSLDGSVRVEHFYLNADQVKSFVQWFDKHGKRDE
jgi:hypothetical protein